MSIKAIVAKCDTPDKSGIVFTRDCLRNIAKKTPSSYSFDEKDGVLYCTSEKTILDGIKKTTSEEIVKLSSKPYSDSIISIQLEMARDVYGKELKDSLIDEFGLEKLGWSKDSDENIRRRMQ